MAYRNLYHGRGLNYSTKGRGFTYCYEGGEGAGSGSYKYLVEQKGPPSMNSVGPSRNTYLPLILFKK